MASGCILIGEKPFGWNLYFPECEMLECTPREASEKVDHVLQHPEWAVGTAHYNRAILRAMHSIPARADQIMDMLRAD
jgi:hypothetical protein